MRFELYIDVGEENKLTYPTLIAMYLESDFSLYYIQKWSNSSWDVHYPYHKVKIAYILKNTSIRKTL